MITAQITGNITRDPELKTMSDGGSVCTISVAVKQKSIKKDGEWVDRDAWYVEADVWSRDAINAVDRLKKGDYVLLTGTLERDQYVYEGQKRERFKLKKTQWELLMAKTDREILKNAGPAQKQQTSAAAGAASLAAATGGDEIPF